MADVYQAKNALLRAGYKLNLREVRDFPHVLEAKYEDVEALMKEIGYTGKFLTERTIKTRKVNDEKRD